MKSLSTILNVDVEADKIRQARANIKEYKNTGTITFLGCDFKSEAKKIYQAAKKIIQDYCPDNRYNCDTCSMVNYNRDCHNNPI